MERLRHLAGSLGGTLERLLQEDRFRQWRQQGGPAGSYRWVVQHPWLVAAGMTIVVGGILAVTFGIPPLSPLILLVIVVAPVPLWLRVEHRILVAWEADPDDSRSDRPPDSEQG